MALLYVGPLSAHPSIAAAMLAAGPNDTIILEGGHSNETADVLHSGMTISGGAGSVGISLRLVPGVIAITLTGLASINVLDAADGNTIIGNEGDNQITVTGGADAVSGGLGNDRLIVDYSLATGAVTGNSTSNFAEAGGGGRLVTVTDGTIEHFTVLTGSGADTITTGNGNDIIETGNGASTVSAGQGANIIVGGNDADTITALDGGNRVDAGNGTNTVTTGSGNDTIATGFGTDTIVSGAGADQITLRGGPDTVDAGADFDRLIIDYSTVSTNVTGGVTSGSLGAGYLGIIASTSGDVVDFVQAEAFDITTGSGNDSLTTGDAADIVSSGLGNDTLRAEGGDDYLQGNFGNDVIYGGAGEDTMFGGSGADMLSGGDGIDTASYSDWSTGVAVDLLAGTAAGGYATGDVLSGIENLAGSTGNDSLTGDDQSNTIFGSGGNDTTYGNAGNDVLDGGDGGDFLQGNLGDDLVHGGLGNDDVRGGQGNDLIFGDEGNDRIYGALGNDVLSGGAGADQFRFTTALGTGNVDTIVDFQKGADHVVLSKAIFTAFAGDTTVTFGEHLRYDIGTSGLYYDADGLGGLGEVQFATVSVAGTLTAGDFMLI